MDPGEASRPETLRAALERLMGREIGIMFRGVQARRWGRKQVMGTILEVGEHDLTFERSNAKVRYKIPHDEVKGWVAEDEVMLNFGSAGR